VIPIQSEFFILSVIELSSGSCPDFIKFKAFSDELKFSPKEGDEGIYKMKVE